MSSTPEALRDTEPVRNSENVRSVLNDGKNRNLWKLPPTWGWSTVGHLTEVIRGASPRPKGDPRYFGGDVPWIMIADVTRQPGKYLYKTREGVTEAGAALSRRIPAGQLILSNSATVCVPKILKVEGCIHDGFVAFPTLQERVLLDFAYYWFEFIRPTMIQENRQGVTQVNLNTAIVRQMHFPLAPRAEQEGVVTEIEKQLSRLDAGVAALRRVQANLKRYRAAVLKAACEGRLVPTEAELARKEGRSFETGTDLLTGILGVRRENWTRPRYQEAVAPDPNLPSLPAGWTWASVDQLLSEPLCNGVSIKGSDEPPGVRALRLSAMSNTGFDYSDIRYLPLDDSDIDDLFIREGDFFMSRGNGSLHLVGRGTSAQKPPEPTIFPDTMIRLRLANPVLTSGWLRTIWPSRVVRAQIETRVKTTAGIYKIAQPQVESIAVPLPPFAEQMRIVAEVERRLSVVEELEATVAANLQRATRLRQSVLQAAFAPAAA